MIKTTQSNPIFSQIHVSLLRAADVEPVDIYIFFYHYRRTLGIQTFCYQILCSIFLIYYCRQNKAENQNSVNTSCTLHRNHACIRPGLPLSIKKLTFSFQNQLINTSKTTERSVLNRIRCAQSITHEARLNEKDLWHNI